MTTINRVKVWIAGDILTAADQNAEFNNIIGVCNGSLDTSNISLSMSPSWSGTHTFSASGLKIKGAGAGTAALTYANTATSRTLTIPNPGQDDTLVVNSWSPIGQLSNIFFVQGADSSQLKITSTFGTALSAVNFGSINLQSSSGFAKTFTITSDITIDLTNAHWGLDGKGNVSGAILRIYAINHNDTSLIWGVGYQGGFTYIRNTQDDTTAANINLPEEILTNANVTVDNSLMQEVGWIKANFTDASNEWAITEYHVNSSADGVWQPWNKTYTGFSADPTSISSAWTQVGKTVFLREYVGTAGTSNATTYTVTAPIKADTVEHGFSVYLSDNAVVLSSPGLVSTNTSSVTIDLYKTMPGGTWTGSSTKHARFGMFYKAFQP